MLIAAEQIGEFLVAPEQGESSLAFGLALANAVPFMWRANRFERPRSALTGSLITILVIGLYIGILSVAELEYKDTDEFLAGVLVITLGIQLMIIARGFANSRRANHHAVKSVR